MSRMCPDSKANIVQVLTFSWLTPLLRLGSRRPLEEQDLWELDEARHANRLGDRLETLFYGRAPPFKRPSEGHRRPTEEQGTGDGLARSAIEGSTDRLVPADKKKSAEFDMSLILAIYHAFAFRIWWTGLLLLVPGALNITTPLVTKLLIKYVTDAFNARDTPGQPDLKPASYGYGLAVAIFAMQQVASICHNQSYYGTLIFGFLLRTSLIPVVFRKALRLSGRARSEHTAGQITTIISADITRLDNASAFIHVMWYSPLLIIVGIALLIVNIGPSALVGLATLVASIPIQGYFVGKMMNLRRSNVLSTDKRVRLLQEVLQGMRVLVLFNWQTHYMERIMGMRKAELVNIRKLSIMRGLVTATTTFMPILAAILTFITYALTGHDLDAATIFSSLQLFNVITTPLTLFPLAAAAISDGVVSLRRIRNLLLAEDIADIPGLTDQSASLAAAQPAKGTAPAVSVHGSFSWEHTPPASDGVKNAAKSAAERDKEYAKLIARWAAGENVDQYAEAAANSEGPTPFALENIALDVKAGSFVAVVGRVGSGKSSLLQAIIGEMRRTAGRVEVNGRIAYTPQSPWIQNATLRDNILFGQPYDEDRYAEVLRACALEHDIAGFPRGDATEIGERGVNLSGGQKARVSLARATYKQSDIILLDDPLSAVDARVSKHIIDEYLLDGPAANKTRILVTHNLHVLPSTDEIIFVDKGRFVDRGTFSELLARQGAFSRMIEEFGSAGDQGDTIDSVVQDKKESVTDPQKLAKTQAPEAQKRFAGDERNVGAVSGSAYLSYFRNAGGLHWAAILLFGLVVAQGATVSSTYYEVLT
ncbi:hypothetical protein AURDEDRAFT_187977 [Auricularia subglabra TFB-10046 SS5]|uniref:P-loop containing nucleoside triphosphate hydrolase protein n=1 Tax=Auricularia subglabra (strain TFB-10046 / SS5) TaxID=717982 RepID=J0WUU9_AURST|nr:hypothetical protein AURDEDRAFT_187977 [Auricularia subglabra TFB-10046 SS5]